MEQRTESVRDPRETAGMVSAIAHGLVWLPLWMAAAIAVVILSPLALVLAEFGEREGIVR